VEPEAASEGGEIAAADAGSNSVASWDELADVPIGVPVGEARCLVLDGFDAVPEGEAGELCIGGPGVARGYLGRPGLTAERFLPDPSSTVPGARMYRTGDRVRWITDREELDPREGQRTSALPHSRTFLFHPSPVASRR
jgi:non-ribosomal peptide synthetase component F